MARTPVVRADPGVGRDECRRVRVGAIWQVGLAGETSPSVILRAAIRSPTDRLGRIGRLIDCEILASAAQLSTPFYSK